jgi:hypothetical protein
MPHERAAGELQGSSDRDQRGGAGHEPSEEPVVRRREAMSMKMGIMDAFQP